MNKPEMNSDYNTRASPLSDVCDYNVRASPLSDVKIAKKKKRKKKKKNAKASPAGDGEKDKNAYHSQSTRLRIATWNLGSLTGRSQELAETLKRRNINICCVQETRWKGSKSRDLGLGYKLVYHGTDSGRNGVGIVLDRNLRDRIVQVERKTDRLMAVKLALDNQTITNIICAYAPQVGCCEAEKADFWDDVDDIVTQIPSSESKLLLGDLNGHVGNNNYIHKTHGGFGYGELNKEGSSILEFASRHGMNIINTHFKKKPEHLITYKSGGKQSQIDFILADDKLKYRFMDCKVIPGEQLTAQHRLLVGVLKLPKPLRTIIDKTPKIKWKELTTSKGETLLSNLTKYLTDDMETLHSSVDCMWNNFEKLCRSEASAILGVAKGGVSTEKDPSWWNEEVKECIQNKKKAFKLWQMSNSEEDKNKYREAKSIAKRTVARTRAESREKLYDRFNDAKSDREIFQLAKCRNRAAQDIKTNKYIKSASQALLTSNEDITNRWYEYYSELMNEEFPSNELQPLEPVEGPVPEICIQEVRLAVKRMKNRKAVGPDEIPAEVWKSIGSKAYTWLVRLFNLILKTEKIPNSWRQSHLIPFYKNKGDVTNCGSYRGIKLTSHTLKIWERVINNRLLSFIRISPNQFGFMPSRSTTDAIQTVRVMTDKHKLNKENLHLIFIDLEKAFDRVPRKLVWQALRAQQTPETYVRLIQDMYSDVCTKVKTVAGLSEAFHVKVGVHQGSALSPLLFNLVMDLVTKDIQEPLPWNMLYADDIVLMSKSATELETTLHRWVKALESAGLKVSRTKTEHLEVVGSGVPTSTIITYTDRIPVPKVQQFKYLGSIVTSTGGIEADVAHRVNAGWLRWRSLTGVLCDSRMPIRVKGKVYKTAVRPALMYGAECWAPKNTDVQKLHTAEMKMLRWAGGVTRLDRVRNEYIRGTFKVAPIPDKLKESRLRWYGHVMRREEDYVVKTALNHPESKRGRGRPPATWWSSIKKLARDEGLPDPTNLDRLSWRNVIRRADPT